jgi:hypothetical protein
VTYSCFRTAFLVFVLAFLLRGVNRLEGAIAISRFEPAHGSAGTPVHIFGQELATATKVYFNGVETPFNFDAITSTIVAAVPKGAVTGRILVFAASGFAASSQDFIVEEPVPRIVSLTREGAVGTDVVLQFDLGIQVGRVDFNGAQASFSALSSTLILARVPAGASSGLITVSYDSGSVHTDAAFTVIEGPSPASPTISGFSPSSGAEGRTVLISGNNLDEGVLVVQFGGVSASFVQRPGGILATVPKGAQSGTITVIASQGVGRSTSPFLVQSVPEISRFEPISGTKGTPVEIFGVGLIEATAVLFDGAPAQFTVNPVTDSLVALVPFDAHSGPITVITPTGKAVSGGDFIFVGSATITSFTASGSAGAEIVLALTGVLPVSLLPEPRITGPCSGRSISAIWS